MPVNIEKSAVTETVSPTLKRRETHLNKLMLVVCDFTEGPMAVPDPPHSHPHEQITYVAEGEIILFLGEEKHKLTQGDMFAVPSNLPHCIQTLSAHVRLIDSFSPVREDFIKS
jgi:mannose-6-phosphate isomerase-like protein (cupin superfamily)